MYEQGVPWEEMDAKPDIPNIGELGEMLEKNALERHKLIEQVRMVGEQSEKTLEIARHLLRSHDMPNEPEGRGL